MKTKITNIIINLLRYGFLITGIIYLFLGEYKFLLGVVGYIVISFLPLFLHKKYKLEFTNILLIFFNLNVVIGFLLGDIFSFYHTFFWWDILAHFSSGIFAFNIGLLILKIFKIKKQYYLFLTFLFVSMFTLMWEVIEFIIDSIFKANMQEWQYMVKEPFVPLVKERGHALVDTMCDMINAILGYVVSIIFYIFNDRK